jgi:RNA ligase (TIGR02306 family)
MRQLATERVVRELVPIVGADRIELARIDGWQCVVKKGDFAVGDRGIYFEIDSMLRAADPRFSFLAKGKVVEFARIKTIRLKGTLSQGLLIPITTLTPSEVTRVAAGEELTVVLGVEKYEPPLPTGGKQAGVFPTHLLPKTDQERIQNIPDVLVGRTFMDYEITEKLDGTSCTVYSYQFEGLINPDGSENSGTGPHTYVGVCSRNWEMQKEDGNVYSKVLQDNDLVTKLAKLGRNIAIQGEIIGVSVQSNRYQLTNQELYVFDIYDIDAKRYLGSCERVELTHQLGLKHVPILTWNQDIPMNLDSLLTIADGISSLNSNTMREGLVFKALDGSLSFKAISNEWLLKHE